MHAITEGSAARIGDSRVRSTQMAEEDKWIVGSRNSASGLLVRPNLLLIIARGSSLGLINCPTSSTFMQLNVQGGALHSGGPSAAALLDPPQGRACVDVNTSFATNFVTQSNPLPSIQFNYFLSSVYT